MGKKKVKPAVEFDEADDGDELPGGDELGDGDELDAIAPAGLIVAKVAATATTPAPAMVAADTIVAVARQHLGESYILGARAPMADAGWRGPWDCAEFLSWCTYRATGLLFGTRPRSDPILADAYTGYWYQQALEAGGIIDWQDAVNIEGAAVLRRPALGQNGHIVLSDGAGGTVEAHSKVLGVIAGTLAGRRWDCGILVPGVRYSQSDSPLVLQPIDATVLRVTRPLMKGDRVRRAQRRLGELNYPVGAADGVYGPQTAFAIRAFQARNGLVADGEIGSLTEKALFAG